MFQLIVAVISIALVAALALASIFYGGEAFTRGQLKAQVTTMINQAQQISGANTLYKTDNGGADAVSVAALVTGQNGTPYLSADITGPAKIVGDNKWGIDANDVYIELDVDAATLTKIDEVVKDGNVGRVNTTVKGFYFPL